MLNKRNILLILFVLNLICLVCSSGCGKNDEALVALARGQVIAMHQDLDEPSASITVVQKDDYGRILFKARKKTIYYADKTVTAYMICQYEEDGIGYCYPDNCYELTYGNNKLSEIALDNLKERNDWNKEIDRTKCKAEPFREYENTADDVLKRLFYSYTRKSEAYLNSYCFDIDMEGKKLHALIYVENEGLSVKGSYELYLIVEDARHELVALEKVEDPLNIAARIIAVKQLSEWKEKLSS